MQWSASGFSEKVETDFGAQRSCGGEEKCPENQKICTELVDFRAATRNFVDEQKVSEVREG